MDGIAISIVEATGDETPAICGGDITIQDTSAGTDGKIDVKINSSGKRLQNVPMAISFVNSATNNPTISDSVLIAVINTNEDATASGTQNTDTGASNNEAALTSGKTSESRKQALSQTLR